MNLELEVSDQMAHSMARYTPGRWHWSVNELSRRVELSNGDLIVIDFVRWGMSSATPRFREDVDKMNIMHPAHEFSQPAPGRAHHAGWHKLIDHPDARLIEAAPALLRDREKLLREIDRLALLELEDAYQGGGLRL